MELYGSIVEGQDYDSERKRIETLQQQNFQVGLHDNIQIMMRAQHHTTL